MESSDQECERCLVPAVREAVGVHSVVPMLCGLVVGYAIAVIGDIVALPGIGPVSGTLAGVVGLAAAVVVFYRTGCWKECNGLAVGPGGCGRSDGCSEDCS